VFANQICKELGRLNNSILETLLQADFCETPPNNVRGEPVNANDGRPKENGKYFVSTLFFILN
jgi:hypothetical protein